jgi:hypothetical protein
MSRGAYHEKRSVKNVDESNARAHCCCGLEVPLTSTLKIAGDPGRLSKFSRGGRIVKFCSKSPELKQSIRRFLNPMSIVSFFGAVKLIGMRAEGIHLGWSRWLRQRSNTLAQTQTLIFSFRFATQRRTNTYVQCCLSGPFIKFSAAKVLSC